MEGEIAKFYFVYAHDQDCNLGCKISTAKGCFYIGFTRYSDWSSNPPQMGEEVAFRNVWKRKLTSLAQGKT